MTLISILAKKLEKKGFENKGYLDMQAEEIALYAGLHCDEWAFADDAELVEMVIGMPLWMWQKWFFTDQTGIPVIICFKER